MRVASAFVDLLSPPLPPPLQQGEEEHRMRSHFDGRAQENDLIAMRKRNMELLSQLHLTDEARL